jgi:hypothetical protein
MSSSVWMITSKQVVFPVPAPPVINSDFPREACSLAFFCPFVRSIIDTSISSRIQVIVIIRLPPFNGRKALTDTCRKIADANRIEKDFGDIFPFWKGNIISTDVFFDIGKEAGKPNGVEIVPVLSYD